MTTTRFLRGGSCDFAQDDTPFVTLRAVAGPTRAKDAAVVASSSEPVILRAVAGSTRAEHADRSKT